jgi:hypothetical protein
MPFLGSRAELHLKLALEGMACCRVSLIHWLAGPAAEGALFLGASTTAEVQGCC